jgi:hypothetical protein
MPKKFLAIGSVLALFASAPCFAGWQIAESENFEVVSQEKSEDMVALTAKLERFKMVLSAFSGVKKERPGGKLRIYWVSNAGRVQSIAKFGDGYLLGYYVQATPYSAIAVTPGKTRVSGSKRIGENADKAVDPQAVLFHEYGHHFMLQNFPVAFPPWFVEGFAEYYGYSQFKENGDIVLGSYADLRRDEFRYLGVMPFKTLFDVKPKPARSSFYGTSWLLTHYAQFNNDRRQELTAYLADVQSGMESVKAAEKNFKGGIQGLEKDVRKYLSNGNFSYQTLGNVKQIGTEQVKLTALPADRAQVIVDEIRYMSGFSADKDERKILIANLEKASKANPTSFYMKAFLADLYLEDDQDDLAIATASQALALNQDYQRARMVKANALMEKAQTLEGANTKRKEAAPEVEQKSEEVGKESSIIVTAKRVTESEPLWAEAKKLIIASNRADAEDPYPLYLYYLYMKRRNDFISEAATDGLAKAHVTVPQYAPIRFALAEEYSAQGDQIAAASVVKPEAFSPHPGDDTRKAKAMLKRFECLAADPKGACVFKILTAEDEEKEAKAEEEKG